MSEEEDDAILLPPKEPKVGSRVLTALSDRTEDDEIAAKFAANNPDLGFTGEELMSFIERDACYQKMNQALIQTRGVENPGWREIEAARMLVKNAFREFQELLSQKKTKEIVIAGIKEQKLERLEFLAIREASTSIKKIQAVLGAQNLSIDLLGKAFLTKHSVPLSLRATGILLTLQEPLVSPPTAPSGPESSETPS